MNQQNLTIHIITSSEVDWNDKHILYHLARIWEKEGYVVSVGPEITQSPDVCILHVDQTKISDEFLPSNLNRDLILNGKVLDVSKRSYSNNLVNQNSDYDGPVIIKSDANYFGLPELELNKSKSRYRFQRFKRKHSNYSNWRWLREIPWQSYPILDCKEDVPQWVWKRKDLIVEKFLPEKEGNMYILRVWVFFGTQEYVAKRWGKTPLIKGKNTIRREYIDDVPESLRAIRKKIGIEFGKFDFVMIDGRPVLLDINKTPTITMSTSKIPSMIKLSKGIDSFQKVTPGSA